MLSNPVQSKTAKAAPQPSKEVASTAKAVAVGKGADGVDLPSAEEVGVLFEPVVQFIYDPIYAGSRKAIQTMWQAPPQVLLFEGGTQESRLAAMHYFVLGMNCQNYNGHDAERIPCQNCPECLGFISHMHRDCFFFDGTEGSIKIDSVREVLPVLGEQPRQARFRGIIFREAQFLGEAAANALLKSLEEPRQRTCFALSAPQRERLLPTIVSRSMILTLPWPEFATAGPELVRWEAELCSFLETGCGFFASTGSKGAVDKNIAERIINLVQYALAVQLRGKEAQERIREGLPAVLRRLPQNRLRVLDEVLAESQDSLLYGVSPALVVEWLATRLYLLLPR